MIIELVVNMKNLDIQSKIYSENKPLVYNSDLKEDLVLVSKKYMYKYSDKSVNMIKNSVFNKEWIRFIESERDNIIKNAVFKYPKSYYSRHLYFLNDQWYVIETLDESGKKSSHLRYFLFIPLKSQNLNLMSAIMNLDPNTNWAEAKSDLVYAYARFISSIPIINNNIIPDSLVIKFNSINNQQISSLHGHLVFKTSK